MSERLVLLEEDADRLERLLAMAGRSRDREAISALQDELERAEIVDAASLPDDVVSMGARVRFLDETSGEEREILLVYPSDADPPRGRVSVLAPIGSALIGLSVGQSIAWPMPDGRICRLRVTSVECPGASL